MASAGVLSAGIGFLGVLLNEFSVVRLEHCNADQLRRMISFGATKINYSTPLFDVVAKRIRQNILTPDAGYAGIVEQARDATRIEVERCIRLWGCGGRAAEILQQSRAWIPNAIREAEEAMSTAVLGASNASSVVAKRRF